MRILLATSACLFLFLTKNFGQEGVFDRTASGNFENTTIYELLGGLEKSYNFRLCCEPEKLPWYTVSLSFRDKTLHEVLKNFLPKHGLAYAPLGGDWVAICRPNNLDASYLRSLRERCVAGEIKLPDFLSPHDITLSIGEAPAAQGSVSLAGTIRDDETKEPIPGAVVLLGGAPVGAPSNSQGQFSLKIPSGDNKIEVRYLGYRDTRIQLAAWQDGEIEIPLKPKPLGLSEVLIQGNRAANKVQNVQTAVEMLPVQTVKELPQFMGEADVVKSLNTLAGVTSAGEGSSGFNVRGGNIDQNLTLQDDAPLFNTSHVLGFFSVYNPDLVRSVTLYKGHVPARYGGRIASVLDVQLRDGDFSETHGSVGIGIATAKIMLETPIVKKRVSALAGFRRSYSDWMLKVAPLAEGKTSSAWFFDGLAKISARLGEKTSFSVSAYQTSDYFRYGQLFGYRWGNRLLNFSLRHPLRSNIVSVWQANIGRFDGGYFTPVGLNNFDLKNGLDYRNAGWRMNWIPNEKHEITAGAQWNRLIGRPESIRPLNDESVVNQQTVAKDRGEEWAVFADDELKIGPKITMSAGLRWVYFRNFGKKTLYTYREGLPRTDENLLDSTVYGPGQTVKGYAGLEPRFSASYKLDKHKALKISYNRMRQYVHLISNLTSPTPVDVWQVSNPYIAPQTSDNFDIGYTSEWGDRIWEFAGDVFWKNTRNVPVFKNFPTLLLNDHLETELLPGTAQSYGAEMSVRKRSGVLSGWLTYTFARTFLQVDSEFPEEAINSGLRFPSDYDQPHQINIYTKHSVNPVVSLAFNYVFRTGRPVSAPDGVYQIGGSVVPNFLERNNVRIPDYHRFDVSLNFDQNKSRISGMKVSFNLSIYNVFARRNPYSVFFEKQPDTYPKAYSLSLVGSAIPAANLVFTW